MPGDVTLDSLHKVLDQEAEAILDARYDALAALAARKEKLMDELTGQPRDEMMTLAARLQHNLTLTERALTGIREAREEIARARAAAERLTTYGPGGQGEVIECPTPGKIHRA